MLFGKKCPSCTTGTRFHRVQRSFVERNLTRIHYTISKANKIAFLTNSRGTANSEYVQAQINANIEISTEFQSIISSSEELTDQEKRRILDTPHEYTLYH